MKRAYIIGSGPNGLSAGIALAQAGIAVKVFEAEAVPGGGARTLPLTLPGFMHDFGSAVHPLAAGSPFFASLPLSNYGLEWIHGEVPLAHPLDDGTAVLLHRDLADQDREFGPDAKAWRSLVQPIVENWDRFAQEALGPVIRIPRHPWLMARFGVAAFQPARRVATHHFKHSRTRALFAGLAAHSFLNLDDMLTSAIALVLGAAAHKVGWPIPRGGSQSITQALISTFESAGGMLHTGSRIDAEAFHAWNSPDAITLFDTSPRQLADIAGDCSDPWFPRFDDALQAGTWCVQGRLRTVPPGSLARTRLPTSHQPASWRNAGGDRRIRTPGERWSSPRSSICSRGTAVYLR